MPRGRTFSADEDTEEKRREQLQRLLAPGAVVTHSSGQRALPAIHCREDARERRRVRVVEVEQCLLHAAAIGSWFERPKELLNQREAQERDFARWRGAHCGRLLEAREHLRTVERRGVRESDEFCACSISETSSESSISTSAWEEESSAGGAPATSSCADASEVVATSSSAAASSAFARSRAADARRSACTAAAVVVAASISSWSSANAILPSLTATHKLISDLTNVCWSVTILKMCLILGASQLRGDQTSTRACNLPDEIFSGPAH